MGNTVFLILEGKVANMADNVTPNRVGFAISPDWNIKQGEQTLGECLDLDFEKGIYLHDNNPEPVNRHGRH